MGPEETVTEIALPALGQRYARLRIVNPSVEALVLRSLQKYGQVSPVMANRAQTEGTYELLDGFKRLRAAEKLGLKHLSTRVLALTPRAAKAAILQLNWVGQSVNHLEEALVLHSLVREDGLSQQEVAVLVGRHDSWVSRRLCLVERLADEVQQSLRLGLVPGSLARELAQLPRGNQEPALACVLKHHLTWRDTRRLVAKLLEGPRWEHACLLASPWEFLDERRPPSSPPSDAGAAAGELSTRLVRLARCSGEVLAALGCGVPAAELPQLRGLIAATLEEIDRVRQPLANLLAPGASREESSAW